MMKITLVVVALVVVSAKAFLIDDVVSCKNLSDSTVREVTRLPEGFDALMDIATDGGGWVVFQRRTSLDLTFESTFLEYSQGFGVLRCDHWLGLEKINQLCNENSKCELRIDLVTINTAGTTQTPTHTSYNEFYIANLTDNFRLTLGNSSGPAGDAMRGSWNPLCDVSGMPFSTKDRNDDTNNRDDSFYYGGWWYSNDTSNTVCSNLNGLWGANGNWFDGVRWATLTGLDPSAGIGVNVYSSEMKLRQLS